MKTLKFTHADGRVSKRQTERPYTHVVIGSYDTKLARAQLTSPAALARLKSDWEHSVLIATLEVDAIWDKQYGLRVRQDDKARSMAFVAKYVSLENYMQVRYDAAMAELLEKHGAGDKGLPVVLQWSMSAKNAAKGLNQFWLYTDKYVAEVK